MINGKRMIWKERIPKNGHSLLYDSLPLATHCKDVINHVTILLIVEIVGYLSIQEGLDHNIRTGQKDTKCWIDEGLYCCYSIF
jgi:hypothetical protein